MPCDTQTQAGQTRQQREQQIKDALARLEAGLRDRSVTVKLGPQGAAAFVGWEGADRDGITDVCAIRRLSASRSWEWRQALAKAEAAGPARFNFATAETGIHSHDGGRTWHKGH